MAESSNNPSSSASSNVEQMNQKFEEREKRANTIRDFSSMEDFTSNNSDKRKVISEIREKKAVHIEEWPDRPEFHETNVFGIPKKIRPSKALKQEWPPREDGIVESDVASTENSETTSEESIEATNAFGLPKNWLENRSSRKLTTKPKPELSEVMMAEEGEKTNALGIPLHWFEKKLAQEEAARKEQKKDPKITAEEIEKIKHDAHEEGFQKGKEEGFEIGHQEGFAKGHEEGLAAGTKDGYEAGIAQAKAEMAEQVAFFATAAQKLARPLDELDNSVASSLFDLSMRLTRQMISFGATHEGEYILDALKQSIAMLPAVKDGIEIIVNSHDAVFLKENYSPEELMKEGWEIKIDDSLQNGDLRVSARDSEISMSLSDQIDSLIREFIRANFS